ncbi:hypothetical protein BGZ50_009872 [Haplosporangium sp. Z 11]|nr:hypothetical protein BGZ50_009872 [Haplosporangium sp. Z 11]
MTLDPIRGDKLTPKYEGPYAVVQRTAHGAYILKDGTDAVLGRQYAPSQLKLVLDDFEDTSTYEVDKIIDQHQDSESPNDTECLVKWKGFSSEDNTWEPEESFIERQCIADYWSEYHANLSKTRRGRNGTVGVNNSNSKRATRSRKRRRT